jgi:hypothetical protein
MANERKRKGGRTTPKSGAEPTPPAKPSRRFDPQKPMGQVGKRPSRPGFLAAVGVAWIVCGIAAFFIFEASWRIVVGVVFIGVGLYWLRGAFATVTRHDERLGEGE